MKENNPDYLRHMGVPERLMLAASALAGAAGVVLGALGAHLPNVPGLSTASAFLLFHAPAILILSLLRGKSRLVAAAQLSMLLGMVLFSGTLSLGALLQIQMKPSPAPFGGALLIFGWLCAATAFLIGGRGKRG